MVPFHKFTVVNPGAMDPEKQPLLRSKDHFRYRFTRPLTSQEVLFFRNDDTWLRVQFSLLFFFWSLIVISILIIIGLLISDMPCIETGLAKKTTVSPAHLSLVPMVYGAQSLDVI